MRDIIISILGKFKICEITCRYYEHEEKANSMFLYRYKQTIVLKRRRVEQFHQGFGAVFGAK